MPSVADLFFVAILCGLIFTPLSIRLLGDAGIGWHIRTGQQILASHAIPRVDSFSSTMAGKPWFAWEWMYDIVVGWLEAACGLNGPVWLTAVVIAAVFAWTFRLLIARGTHLCAAIALVLLAMSASTIHFLARPHVISWLLALAWFWILDSTEQESLGPGTGLSRFHLWTLPILMLLWVNLHGGFLLGFALLAMFWLGSLWTWLRLKDFRIQESLQKIAAGKRAWDLTLVGLASFLASLVNPYAWKLHEHIYSYLSNRFLMNHIDEFQSPNFHGLAQRCFLILLLVSLAILIVRGRALRVSAILVVLFAVYAGLYASRNIPISSILLVMIAGPLFPAAPFLRDVFGRMRTTESSMKGHLWPILFVLITLGIVFNRGRVGSNQWMDAQFGLNRMPVEAVNFLETEHTNGPILSPDYWGGYLIYRLAPKERVVLDDRHDFYGADFLQSYLKMLHVEDGWDAFLHETNPACVLLPRGSALANMMGKTAGWRSSYADSVSIVFVPDRGAQRTNGDH